MTLSDYLISLFLVCMFTLGYATLYNQIGTTVNRSFERVRNLNASLQHLPQIIFVLLTLVALRIIEISLSGTVYWVFINMQAVILIFSNLIVPNLTDFVLIQVVGLYTLALTGGINWTTGSMYVLGCIIIYGERWYGPKISRHAFVYYLPPMLLGAIFWIVIGIKYHAVFSQLAASIQFAGFAISYIALANYDRFQERDQQLINRLQHDVQYDGLTQIRNWAMFQKDFSKAFANRHATKSLALVTLDIDHFKRINDNHGHLVGNQALILVATRLNHELGQLGDNYHAYRTGGEEFTLILPGANREVAQLVAEQCAAMIQALPVHIRSGELRLTASFGVAIANENDTSATSLYKRADDYLYQAKNAGRNQVSVEGTLLFNK